MKKRPTGLDVFLNDDVVGTAFDTEPISFEYADSWLVDPNALAVGRIIKQPGRQDGAEVVAFFDNLLPEGDLRAHLARKHQASTVFSLLLELGGDSVGAFVLLPSGEQPKAPSYERTSWGRIAKALRQNHGMAVDIKVKDARISLSGAQDKTSIALDGDGAPMLPVGYSPSTHILKPDIERIRGVFASAANETIVMGTARRAGLDVADTFYEPLSRSCVIARFDRIGRPPAKVERLVQYDFCQLSATPSSVKYEAEGGPGLRRCAEIIRAESAQPAVDLLRLVDWVFFNLYVGNNDSHAKNLSIYRLPDKGVVLTPFYDLVCTRMYKTLSANFAFAIGGQRNPGNIEHQHVVTMAKEIGVRAELAVERAEALAALVPDALEASIEEVKPHLDNSGSDMAANLRKLVLSTTRKSVARMLSQPGSTRRAVAGQVPVARKSSRKRTS